eukprot:CAMPEP_0117492450 /NCGR_PEP_ID=MMETSP0784-20121206/18588_1 /TAXON_ID=39447 /ORGANISM="" /LENGTH=795 /DNA_ID=CAMNT_0005287271 /DNA_START=101 /DNA_END=2488 /DNA_ORIENTATION=+
MFQSGPGRRRRMRKADTAGASRDDDAAVGRGSQGASTKGPKDVVHHHPPKDFAVDIGQPVRGGQTLLIAYFPWEASEADIERELSKFCQVKRVHLVVDKSSRKPRCFGFVKFMSKADAELALRATSEGLVVLPDTRGHVWHLKAEWTKSGDMVVDDSEIEQEVAKRKEERRGRLENRAAAAGSGVDGESGGAARPPLRGKGGGKGGSTSVQSSIAPKGALHPGVPPPLPPLQPRDYPTQSGPLGLHGQAPMMPHGHGHAGLMGNIGAGLPQHSPPLGHQGQQMLTTQQAIQGQGVQQHALYSNVLGGVQGLTMYNGQTGPPLYGGHQAGLSLHGGCLPSPVPREGPQLPLHDAPGLGDAALFRDPALQGYATSAQAGFAQGYPPPQGYVASHQSYAPSQQPYAPQAYTANQSGYAATGPPGYATQQPVGYPPYPQGLPPYLSQQVQSPSLQQQPQPLQAQAQPAQQQTAQVDQTQAQQQLQQQLGMPPPYGSAAPGYSPPSGVGYPPQAPGYSSEQHGCAQGYGLQHGALPAQGLASPGHSQPCPYTYLQHAPPPPRVMAYSGYPGGNAAAASLQPPALMHAMDDPSQEFGASAAAHSSRTAPCLPQLTDSVSGAVDAPTALQVAEGNKAESAVAPHEGSPTASGADGNLGVAANTTVAVPPPGPGDNAQYLDMVWQLSEMSLHEKSLPAPPSQQPPAPPANHTVPGQWQTEPFREAAATAGGGTVGNAGAVPQAPENWEVPQKSVLPPAGTGSRPSAIWNAFDDAAAKGMVDGLVGGEDGAIPPVTSWTGTHSA